MPRINDDSDDSHVSFLSGDDPDIGTTAPVWSILTAAMRTIAFVKKEQLLVSKPGEEKLLDILRLLVDDVILEDIFKFTNAKDQHLFFNKPDLNSHSRIT